MVGGTRRLVWCEDAGWWRRRGLTALVDVVAAAQGRRVRWHRRRVAVQGRRVVFREAKGSGRKESD